ncbi:hypothetical protein AVEN_17745-1 [Araneus ventricosus]|uniref:Tc1-like transposase DDE domain-containing protein n=1 Tax=Araneus ventricosus TaxID=182803 RepID=A0A4Y2FBE0_ARAVE|nr:hypothetical protein AVEN_17745-1 [Araneus ventricosus]
MPILKERMYEGFIFQQDDSPCHFHNEVTSYLDADVPVRIARGGVSPWPARSPDLKPLDFSAWGFIKDQVYHPPLPKSIPELKSQITTALRLINVNMLTTSCLN